MVGLYLRSVKVTPKPQNSRGFISNRTGLFHCYTDCLKCYIGSTVHPFCITTVYTKKHSAKFGPPITNCTLQAIKSHVIMANAYQSHCIYPLSRLWQYRIIDTKYLQTDKKPKQKIKQIYIQYRYLYIPLLFSFIVQFEPKELEYWSILNQNINLQVAQGWIFLEAVATMHPM